MRPAPVGRLVGTGKIPEGDARATLNPGIGVVVVGAPEEVDRPARDRARPGERVFPPGSVRTDERGVEGTEDSGR
jgi:hypothetical protein